jgi:hypothetical protein
MNAKLPVHLKPPTKEEVSRLLVQFDLDEDGTLDSNEFFGAIPYCALVRFEGSKGSQSYAGQPLRHWLPKFSLDHHATEVLCPHMPLKADLLYVQTSQACW